MSLQQVPSDNKESRIEPRDDHNHFDRNWNFNQSFFLPFFNKYSLFFVNIYSKIYYILKLLNNYKDHPPSPSPQCTWKNFSALPIYNKIIELFLTLRSMALEQDFFVLHRHGTVWSSS